MRPATSAQRRLVFKTAMTVAILLSAITVWAQTPLRPGDKAVPPNSSRRMIPVIKVTPRPIRDDSPAIARLSGKVGSPPGALSPSERGRLLRESGVDFRPPSAPAEFKLSPRDPYVSSAAYLLFTGNVHFSAASNEIFVQLPETNPLGRAIPLLEYPEWLYGERRESGPQPDPPGLIAVRIRFDGPGRYLADFSVSAENSTTYKLKVSGAGGTGSFAKPAGGQHVVFVIDASGTGYAQIDCWADRSFTFHNVVVTKLD